MAKHETNHTRPDGTYVSYSSYSHPYQLRGRNFKTRTYHTYAGMEKGAARVLSEPGAPDHLEGYRHFDPGGRGRALRLIEIFYPAAVADEYPPHR